MLFIIWTNLNKNCLKKIAGRCEKFETDLLILIFYSGFACVDLTLGIYRFGFAVTDLTVWMCLCGFACADMLFWICCF